MKTILYLGNTYCSNIIELKSIIDSSPAQDSLLGKELLCALKDGTLSQWLKEGNEEEQSLASELYQIQSGSSDSDLLKRLGECFKSNYRTKKLNLTDFILLQTVESIIGNKPCNSLPLKGANITCSREDTIEMLFSFRFKVEKTIGENVNFHLRISMDNVILKQTKVQEINLRELNNTLEIKQALSYIRPEIEYQSIPKIELVSTFMGQESVLWFSLLSTNIINIGDISFKMIFVEGGTFNMGEGGFRSTPIHKVTLDNFFIAETQVTQKLWTTVMGKNPSNNRGNEQYPVENISWKDCQSFISRLNQITGLVFRLPTEAEWEYAAKGGIKTAGYPRYSGGNRIKDVGWYDSNSNRSTHPVKKKQPNELGIYDMSGNVCEWCQDIYDSYVDYDQFNPRGAEQGKKRVLRGGSYYSDASSCTHTSRAYQNENTKESTFGLRLALDA